jgi:acetyl-CoA synthetase
MAIILLSQIENCLDRHVNRSPESVALIWEKDEPGTHETVTYRWVLENSWVGP